MIVAEIPVAIWSKQLNVAASTLGRFPASGMRDYV
jgi:hypothetical protein